MVSINSENSFRKKFLEGLLIDCHKYQAYNSSSLLLEHDFIRRIKHQLRDSVHVFAMKHGFVRGRIPIEKATENLDYILSNIEELEGFYNLLSDEYSKQMLIELLKYRVLGQKHVKFPINNKVFWKELYSIDRLYLKKNGSVTTEGGSTLNRYEIKGSRGAITLDAQRLSILNTFLLKQYAYSRATGRVEAQEGDFVIDGGSCWGDTSLYFADLTGPKGKVFSFEFVENNIQIQNDNLKLNHGLEDTVKIISSPLDAVTGKTVDFIPNGPGSTIDNDISEFVINNQSGARQDRKIYTVAIDDMVKDKTMEKVDFIKLDVEGSELNVLKGSRETILKYRPKMAISIYHKLSDFVDIPKYLSSICKDYEFFLDHFHLDESETIVFAKPKAH